MIVELEALGAPGDVASPQEIEYRQLLRTTPREPEFVKKATWQDTLIASREALHAWENVQDFLALSNSPVTLGPWYVLGPLPARSKDVAVLRSAQAVDLGRRYQVDDGKEIGWQRRDDLRDGQLHDLAGSHSGSRQAVYFLCRTVSLQRDTQRHEIGFDAAAERGWAVWLPQRSGGNLQNNLPLLQGGHELNCEEGPHQYLVQLQPNKEGQAFFYFAVKPNRSRPGGGQWSQRVAIRDRLLGRVRAEFAGADDQLQMRWELESDIWGSPERRFPEDWLPGRADVYLKARYRAAAGERLQKLSAVLAETSGVTAAALCGVKDRLQAWHDAVQKSLAADLTAAELRAKFYHLATVQEAIALAGRPRSLRLAVEDHRQMFQQRVSPGRRLSGPHRGAGKQSGQPLGPGPGGKPGGSTASLLGVKQELDAAQGADAPRYAAVGLRQAVDRQGPHRASPAIGRGRIGWATSWWCCRRSGPMAGRPRSTRARSATWTCTGTASGCCFPTAGCCGR